MDHGDISVSDLVELPCKIAVISVLMISDGFH